MYPRATFGILVAAAVIAAAHANAAAPAPVTPALPGKVASIAPALPYASDQLIDPTTASLRAAVASLLKDKSANQRDAAGIAAFYAEHDYAPLWTGRGTLNDKARALIARLASADADGLDPQAYPVPAASLGQSAPAPLAELASADVMLSQSLVAYARQAYAGRLVPSSVSPNIGYEQHLPDPYGALRGIALADDPVATLAAFNPPQKEFAQLRDALAELRKKAATEEQVRIPDGASLKPGMTDARVPLLRTRFDLPPATDAPEVYDDTVVAAVKTFQQENRIKADGVIGKGTIAAINKGNSDRIATILANMERWRWMPRYLGRYYVRVNIPDFTLDVHKDGEIIHTTRIVVGKVELQTPIFSDEIQYVIVNPSWSVPSSIIAKEYLPALRGGGYPKGFDVFAKVGGRFRAVDPRTVNWASVGPNDVQFRQPPGERNALGVVKFMFPNKYSVYLHDTPSKGLFNNDYRAASHGCMRVMNPWGFADALLTDEDWNSARLKKLIGGPETKVDLHEHVYVHITYFTAWVDADGNLQFRNDVYGHDKRVETALGLVS